MELKEVIYKRKSNRKYRDELLSDEVLEDVINFVHNTKAIYPDIKFRIEFVSNENVKCILPWIPKQNIVIYSEEKEGYLENIGFIFEQLDLYLHSIGIGCCWLGMGKPDSVIRSKMNDDMKFVIMLSIGYPEGELFREIKEFKRMPLSKISDIEDERLEPARYAPSSVNSQPWYFVHENDIIHMFLRKHSLLSKMGLKDMNHIDDGIALAHMYVANVDSFKFFKLEGFKNSKIGEYIGSFRI